MGDETAAENKTETGETEAGNGHARTYKFKALTDLWTGDIDGKPDKLISTGILGSIRWWFEVVARGLGGEPCDPSSSSCLDRKHCVACETFGCTGWARKFCFAVLDEKGMHQSKQIKQNDFGLQFTPLRSIRNEEWTLIDLTLQLIANHGAIGGKTVYKPSDENTRKNQDHHKDYGLIKLTHRPTRQASVTETQLREYVGNARWQRANPKGFAWASLTHFWSVSGRYLTRSTKKKSTFNQVIGRPEDKKSAQKKDSWLAGGRGESKKVFSFRDPPRTFGFVNPGTINHEEMKKCLNTAWPDPANADYQTGNNILGRLLESRGMS